MRFDRRMLRLRAFAFAGLAGFAFFFPGDTAALADSSALPQFDVGAKRQELLSRLRNDLLEAVKQRDAARMDSALAAGDREFSTRIWLDRDERLILYLLLGKGDAILRDGSLRLALWGVGLEYPEPRAPAFCPRVEYHSRSDVARLGYAPDLIDHLINRLKAESDSVAGGLKAYPDLADFYAMARCDEEGQGKPAARVSPERALAAFLGKHPRSPFADDIRRLSRRKPHWTGNGWTAGAGPSFAWRDRATASLITDGVQGGFFTGLNFPGLKIGMEGQFREFTAHRPFRLRDTVFAAGTKGYFNQGILDAGYAFETLPDLFLTPFAGLLLTDFGLTAMEEDRLGKKGFDERSYGFCLGTRAEYMAKIWAEPGMRDDVAMGLGFRLSAAYHHGPWQDMERGLGEQGFLLSAQVFIGLVGYRED